MTSKAIEATALTLALHNHSCGLHGKRLVECVPCCAAEIAAALAQGRMEENMACEMLCRSIPGAYGAADAICARRIP